MVDMRTIKVGMIVASLNVTSWHDVQ